MQNLTKNYWVAKFGGTSVATYQAIVRCVKLLNNYPNVRVIVVSAPAGMTNLLLKLSQSHLKQLEIPPILDAIKIKVHAILECLTPASASLNLRAEVLQILEDIKRLASSLNMTYSKSQADELLSCGERISARLFACVLLQHGESAVHLDARSLIKTNASFGQAAVLIQETANQVSKHLLPKCLNHLVVTEGFIGSTKENITTTLGRGGSDYSAALLAEAINAHVLQIWTDVPGIYTVDPNLIAQAKLIKNMCFAEAAELAQFGAKVLHPATLWPAIRKCIPIFVGSSFHPEKQGTWIRPGYIEQEDSGLVRAIALRRNQSLLTIHSLDMLQTHGFLAKIFVLLAKYELSIDVVTTSEVSVALTLNHFGKSVDELLTQAVLEELKLIGNVSLLINKHLTLVTLVGKQLHQTPGICQRIFNQLHHFNIRLICHGASANNVCFLVDDNEADDIIRILHAEFFEKNTIAIS